MVDISEPFRDSNILELLMDKKFKVYVYDPEVDASKFAITTLLENECEIVDEINESDIAIAPLLNKKLTKQQYEAPTIGTLIFHPSLLPRHRGPDAIKWAYRMNESYTGVTWFWCSEGYDEGDICDQEIVELNKEVKPGAFYSAEILPAMQRTLGRIIRDLKVGIIRRVPQNHTAATYESKIHLSKENACI